ncbi:hypothetical protein CBR56_29075 [Bacillus thuringiensis]|uniref:DUF4183 domain-containing protein n=1 Tax=Bacillus tropicus TaxID=2026188 RepID=UPI000B445198|nr:DUF4183 domain-containing protein [Bacillus tropicus]MED3038485.1 DUF4183 domain-containing protein [Bacillus tropicus]OTX77263.1 hypothetical protein BK728_24190 [Bacillus thuringiensis serovar chanpaisis]PNK22542.1 hypothetical protein CBR56_29075 [Bacillus thuringiensis]
MIKKWNNCDPKRPLDIIYPSFYRISNFMYHTIAKKKKYKYTNEDALTQHNSSTILSPHEVSYFNLFVNGVIQPLNTYTVNKGELIFLTENLPIIHTPITLQFIIIS